MSQRPKWPELIWGFLSMKHHIAYSPLDGTLVNQRVTPQQYVVVTHLYTWVRRDRVKRSSLYKETTQWARLVDLHLPCDLSFQYYNSHDFHDNHCINEYLSDKCFSALHCNPRCLLANFWLFATYAIWVILIAFFNSLSLTDTEIKLKGDQSFLPIIEMPGYLFTFQPSLLNAQRVGVDNIFFNSLEHLTWSGNIVYDLIDHLPNFLIVKKFTSLPNNVKIYKRNYSNFDESALIQDIQSVDLKGVLHANPDPNVMFDSFHTRISDIIYWCSYPSHTTLYNVS